MPVEVPKALELYLFDVAIDHCNVHCAGSFWEGFQTSGTGEGRLPWRGMATPGNSLLEPSQVRGREISRLRVYPWR